MNVSFDGIGLKPVTFICKDATAGQVVKVSGAGQVAACATGDAFDGIVAAVNGDYVSVMTDGFVTVSYTGTAPSVGRTALCADGKGGVKADTAGGKGDTKLVVGVDTVKNTVTFKM